jgi:predicted dehydrogenase
MRANSNKQISANNPLAVLVVGCGNIAGIFDQDRLGSSLPFTHAGAYSSDERFTLVACVDPDDSRRIKFMDFWGVANGFRTIADVLNSDVQFDVVSICSPSDCHEHDLEIALRLKPKLIFCEKPVTTSLKETKRLVDACRDNKILLAVNYSRRFDPDVLILKADMDNGKWGQLRSVAGCYNKGLLNNGSHMIDLLHLLIGGMKIVKVGESIQDFFQNDSTVPVWLEGQKGLPIHIACGHAKDYSIFEIQFVFANGMLIMEDGGLFWRERRVEDSNTFKGYRVLNEGVRRAGKYPGAMKQSVDNIYRAITKGEPLISSGDSALHAQQMCEKIKQMVIAK